MKVVAAAAAMLLRTGHVVPLSNVSLSLALSDGEDLGRREGDDGGGGGGGGHVVAYRTTKGSRYHPSARGGVLPPPRPPVGAGPATALLKVLAVLFICVFIYSFNNLLIY